MADSTTAINRKRFSLAEQTVRKLNGDNSALDLSPVTGCADDLQRQFGASLEAFLSLPSEIRRAARMAVKNAYCMAQAPSDEQAFGLLTNIRGNCKRIGEIKTEDRTPTRRLLSYFASNGSL